MQSCITSLPRLLPPNPRRQQPIYVVRLLYYRSFTLPLVPAALSILILLLRLLRNHDHFVLCINYLAIGGAVP